jgi:hypothetical protein
MPWIKRNLLFVVGLAVAVALLGFGIFFYLLDKRAAALAVDEELNSKNTEYTTLAESKPAPTQENIKEAKEQQVKLLAFKESLRPQFSVIPLPEALDDAAFKNLLDRTIDALSKQAERNGVKLPTPAVGSTRYAFTFDTQIKQLEFTQRSLAPLSAQLLDVQDLCRALFDSKIHALESIRRTPVNTNDISPPSNYLAKKVQTNSVTGAAVFPYEVTFQCFSAELANVLEALANSTAVYLVKSVNIERGSAEGISMSAVASAPGAGGMSPALANRYGMGNRYGGAQAATASSPTRPGDPVLDDKPLRVTLNIEVIKVTPAAPKKG